MSDLADTSATKKKPHGNIGKKRSPETIEKLRLIGGRKTKKISVEGVIYSSAKEVIKHYGIHLDTCYSRAKDPNFPRWYYVT